MASFTTQLPPNSKISHETFLYEVFSYYFFGAFILFPNFEKNGIA
jgi:hypothetical protein